MGTALAQNLNLNIKPADPSQGPSARGRSEASGVDLAKPSPGQSLRKSLQMCRQDESAGGSGHH